MHATDVAVIGGGQAGLAMSRCLFERGVDHVVFERGNIAERWETRAWDSLRLLTPNWLNALPGLPYRGNDPDGFMSHEDFAARLRSYAVGFAAPVLTRTEVVSVEPSGDGFLVTTEAGPWRARAIVIATGHCDVPDVPSIGTAMGPSVLNLHSSQYRSPGALPEGGVLVVGASASGVQIADELQRAGRQVTLSVGRHTRLPRRWRGRDIHWWLDRTGMLTQRTVELPCLEAAMREPAPQLAGRPDGSNVDLPTLQTAGVRLAGRVVAADGETVSFADDLAASVGQAEAKQERVLDKLDEHAGLPEGAPKPRIMKVNLSLPRPPGLSFRQEGIGTVIWATGYRRSFPWLKLDVLTSAGEIAHREGVTAMPGVYALGFRLLRKRDSHFIGGVGSDAQAISDEIYTFLGGRGRRAA